MNRTPNKSQYTASGLKRNSRNEKRDAYGAKTINDIYNIINSQRRGEITNGDEYNNISFESNQVHARHEKHKGHNYNQICRVTF